MICQDKLTCGKMFSVLLIDHLNVMNLLGFGQHPHSFSFFTNLSRKLQNQNPPQRLTLPCHRGWHHWFPISLSPSALLALHNLSYICPVVPYALSLMPLMNPPGQVSSVTISTCDKEISDNFFLFFFVGDFR